jgi:biopolymer transport protein ExbB
MLRAMKSIMSLAVVAALAAPVAASAAAAAAGNLDQLLEQTRNARAAEAKENQARVSRFQQERDKQAALLAQAKGELAQAQARANALSAQFDANEKKLTEAQAALDAKIGNLGEMFGVVRQVAGDFSSVTHNSMVSVQYPERTEFAQKLAQVKSLPSIADLEQFWFEMQREMTETGKVVSFQTGVIEPDGAEQQQKVTRVGPFIAVAEDRYLSYLPASRKFTVLPRQPDSPLPGMAEDFAESTSGYSRMVVDPTRGVLLALYVQRPSVLERIEQGEWVGYVIITVGVVGALLAAYQFVFLFGIGIGVRRQLYDLDNPSTDNPLGRVLATFKGDASKIEQDAEIVELRISEAVLREVPKLERFQSFLRLAVAAGPLLGLIGTVIGMIITFQSIVESGSGDPKLMAAGIGQAMIATVLGLGIAVPLLFINAALQSRSRQIVQILDEQSTGLLAERLEAQKRA